MRAVVTGANGFVGRAVCAELVRRGHQVTALVREKKSAQSIDCTDMISIGRLEQFSDLSNALRGADVVVHTAGWAGTASTQATPSYVNAVNVQATARLSTTAAHSGIGHFIYLSSVKAIGSQTLGTPFTAKTHPAPTDLYGRSKLAAEQAILQNARMRITIVRPPLIYGPAMSGSMLKLFLLAHRNVPMPFGSIKNARDILALPSLADLVAACVESPCSVNRVLLARDGAAVSSAFLYRRIAAALGQKARVVPFPPQALRLVSQCVGRAGLAESLLSSLEIDDSGSREELGWSPVCDMNDALQRTAEWYKSRGT